MGYFSAESRENRRRPLEAAESTCWLFITTPGGRQGYERTSCSWCVWTSLAGWDQVGGASSSTSCLVWWWRISRTVTEWYTDIKPPQPVWNWSRTSSRFWLDIQLEADQEKTSEFLPQGFVAHMQGGFFSSLSVFFLSGHEKACSLRQTREGKKKKPFSARRWRLQLVIAGASSAPPWPKGFTGAGESDKAGFKVKIKQKNLPGRNPALTRQKNLNPKAVPAF